MSIDAFDRIGIPTAVGRGIAEKGEHILLACRLFVHGVKGPFAEFLHRIPGKTRPGRPLTSLTSPTFYSDDRFTVFPNMRY